MKLLRLPFALSCLSLSVFGFAQVHPHNFHLIDVKWHVDLKTYESTGTLNGDVVNTLKVLADPASVSFDCAKLNVTKVEVDDKSATFTTDGKLIKVDLPAGTVVGQTVKIHVTYNGRPQAGIYMVPGERAFPAHTNVIYTQGEMEDNRYWLPTWDYPDDKATSEGTIEVGKGEIAISNGKLVDVKDTAGGKIFHWKMSVPHATYLISIVAGKYDAGHGLWGKMPVDYYVPQGLMNMGEPTFGKTEDIIDFYSKLTGFAYPYDKFCQSAVPDYMFGGMENITAVTQTITALHPKSTEPLTDATGLVAHELAHQWFGDTVTCNGWSDAWLNEGFATFLPHFWMRKKYGQDEFDLGRYGDFQGGLSAHQSQQRPVVYAGYKDALDMFNNFIYPGGASRMFMLMDQLGEEKFWKAISAYLNERKYTSLDTPMFFESMSKATGVDLTPFMKQWFYTPAAPNLTVTERDGTLTVTQPEPYFNLTLDVWTLDGGSWFKKKLQVSGHESTLELGNQAGKPVLVDPRCYVMANIREDIPFSVDERTQLFLNAPNAGEKARMLDTMMDGLSQDQWLALAKQIKSPVILDRVLGRLGTSAESYLIELTNGTDRKLANTAASVLGNLPKTSAILDRLHALYESDPNELIRLTALQSLVNLTQDEALIQKAWTTDGYRDEFRQFALGWWQGHNQDAARENCLDILAHPTSEPLRVSAIGMLGGLKDKPGDTRVYEALTGILKETSFGARSRAISALAQYGNPDAIKLLIPLKTDSLVFFRQAADGAIATLSAIKKAG
jgi:aminopeptidase N